MAFAATTIWDVQTVGSDTMNGGGFDPGNAGFATDLTTDANTANTSAPVVSSATYNFDALDVGHWLFLKSGTNWIPGWYLIASVASNKATLTAIIGSANLYLGATNLNTVVGIATVGTPTAGTWGIDYSRSTTPRISYTDMVIGGTTTQFTSVLSPVGKNLVGNVVSVTSGVNVTVQRVQVVSTSGTTATCDKSLGTAAAVGVGGLGGCLLSPGLAGSVVAAGNDVFIKSGTYDLSSTSNVSGGRITHTPNGTLSNPSRWVGYQTLRGDNGTKPLLRCGAGTMQSFTVTGDFVHVVNLEFDGNSQTTVEAIRSDGTNLYVKNCKFTGLTSHAIRVNTGTQNRILDCDFVSCSGTACVLGVTGMTTKIVGCTARSCTAAACFSSVMASRCAAVNSVKGFTGGASGAEWENCLAYGNSSDGFDFGATAGIAINCLSYGNTDRGYEGSATNAGTAYLINCAGGGNGANYDEAEYPVPSVENFITLTVDPFTNAAGLDFTLNNTAGGGAMLRAAGYPSTLPGLSGINYPDVGAFQSQAVAPDYPDEGDVRDGVGYGDAQTGTLEVPAEADVRSGTQYGAGGTEFTGTLASGGGVVIHRGGMKM